MPADDAEDPALAAWPPELRQAWADLRLPSLAEQLTAYERLAAEVRRQNTELRRLGAALDTLPRPGDDGGRLAAALEAARNLATGLARAQSESLIDLQESCERHADALAATVDRLAASPPSGWFGRPRPWPPGTIDALRGQVEGARLVAGKALERLADAGLVAIDPAPGDPFDPACHRCVGTAPGAAQRVVRRERRGWRQGDRLLRPADVFIGKDPA